MGDSERADAMAAVQARALNIEPPSAPSIDELHPDDVGLVRQRCRGSVWMAWLFHDIERFSDQNPPPDEHAVCVPLTWMERHFEQDFIDQALSADEPVVVGVESRKDPLADADDDDSHEVPACDAGESPTNTIGKSATPAVQPSQGHQTDDSPPPSSVAARQPGPAMQCISESSSNCQQPSAAAPVQCTRSALCNRGARHQGRCNKRKAPGSRTAITRAAAAAVAAVAPAAPAAAEAVEVAEGEDDRHPVVQESEDDELPIAKRRRGIAGGCRNN